MKTKASVACAPIKLVYVQAGLAAAPLAELEEELLTVEPGLTEHLAQYSSYRQAVDWVQYINTAMETGGHTHQVRLFKSISRPVWKLNIFTSLRIAA